MAPITTASRQLEDIHGAIRELKMSRQFLYRLPDGTPGVYRFGRALRFDVDLLRDWAAKQAGSVE